MDRQRLKGQAWLAEFQVLTTGHGPSPWFRLEKLVKLAILMFFWMSSMTL
jgi:hypothetical protein